MFEVLRHKTDTPSVITNRIRLTSSTDTPVCAPSQKTGQHPPYPHKSTLAQYSHWAIHPLRSNTAHPKKIIAPSVPGLAGLW